MTMIPNLPNPGAPRPHWMTAVVTGQSTNGRLPLSHLGGLPRGQIHLSLAPYLADTASTVAGDPGAGNVRWNHATQASATELYVDDADTSAVDHAALWATLDAGGYLYLYEDGNLDNWQQWQITAVSDETGYLKLTVTHQASSGSFAAAAPIFLTLQQPEAPPGIDRSTVTAVVPSSGVATLDCALGDYFTMAPTANITGWAFTNVPQGCSIMLKFTQDSTPRTVAWAASFRWAGGTDGVVSTGSGAIDLLALTTFDFGTTWMATLAKAFSP